MIQSIIFFGAHCDFADRVLHTLEANGYSIAARVVPGRHPEVGAIVESTSSSDVYTGPRLPVLQGNTGTLSNRSQAWPTYQLNDRKSPASVRTLDSLGADLAVVCCYPGRLPLSLVNAANRGGLNVHPSLLPRYRGPDPLFWVYRNGETETGVTVHRISEALDAGAIVRQQRIELPVGTPGDEVWTRSAEIGASLLLESITALNTGNASLTVQDHDVATYQTWPGSADLLIRPREWDAWHVYHFCRGVIPLNHMPRVREGSSVRRVLEATGYADESGAAGHSVPGTETRACRTGEVYLRLGPAIS